MLIGVLQENTLDTLAQAAQSLDATQYDLLELRLDKCADLSPEGLSKIRLPLPAIFTLRTREQGGSFDGSEDERLRMLEALICLQPAYIDIESTVPAERIASIRSLAPSTRLIISQHDFEHTPEDLNTILLPMLQAAPKAIYKFATFANSTLDALRMLAFCREQTAKGLDVLGICMGPYGATTRILAPVVHTGLCYCPITDASAPGQLAANVLRNTYNFSSLNHDTAIYALLGDPVEQSIGHLYHNEQNRRFHRNAVYVKWQISKEEVPAATHWLRKLGVKGLSVTMPLKETILPSLAFRDADVQSIGAANTIVCEPDGWYGHNTDGFGAVQALGCDPANKKIVVLGAGGAAKAIIHELQKYTDHLQVLNRTCDKSLPNGQRIRPLADFGHMASEPYDIIINTLPAAVPLPFTEDSFHADAVAMDISYGKASEFLRQAALRGCQCIDGTALFKAQAERQRRYWNLPFAN